MRWLFLLLICCFHLSVSLVDAATKLTYSLTSNPTEELIVSLLELGVSHINTSENFEFEAREESLTEARKVQMLKEGTLDVIWMGTQIDHENNLYPVRVPILKGMLGHRIFIIRNGEQGIFDKVDTLLKLKNLSLGQGKYWGDTAVLKQAGMNVVDPVKYESLFHMLEGGRFDYFPRALHEPWSEVTTRRELKLVIEEKHLLVYPFALYFFVALEKQKFGEQLHQGLLSAIENGSYDSLFYQHPVIEETIQRANLNKRVVHRLPNPYMSDATPISNAKLWLDLTSK